MKKQKGVKGHDMAEIMNSSRCRMGLDRKAGLERQDLVCKCHGKKEKKKKTLLFTTEK